MTDYLLPTIYLVWLAWLASMYALGVIAVVSVSYQKGRDELGCILMLGFAIIALPIAMWYVHASPSVDHNPNSLGT